MMMLLLDYLRRQLKMTAAQLEDFVQSEHERLKNLLLGLPIYTGHNEERLHLICDGISKKSVRELRVNDGGIETTMEQFLYSKYGLLLRKPCFPCLIHRAGIFGLDAYYPLECIYTEGK
jgi:hypothetical protein